MHDIRLIREKPQSFDQELARRGLSASSSDILALDEEYRALQTAMQEAQARRNDLSKKVGEIKRGGGDAAAEMEEVATFKDKLIEMEAKERELGDALKAKLSSLPNILFPDVVPGKDDTDSKELHKWGEIPKIDNPKEHFELGEALGMMDIPRATRMSGSRFTMLTGPLAQMERALGAFMLDVHTSEHGYMEVSPPLLVRDEIMFGVGQLPKFKDDMFRTTNGLWLLTTAEVALTNIYHDEIMDKDMLPFRVTARTPCFRSEAGSAGKDMRGMLRQHQFYKTELVTLTTADQSCEEHERMLTCAEEILKRLKLPFRTVMLCTGDTSFSAKKTYDIEVWLPGQNTYREISSCSNCGDFQARRMNTRCKAAGDKQTEFIHTLNGSGIAIGRALIAVMENYQQPDGSIIVPDVLRPYMGGLEKITKA